MNATPPRDVLLSKVMAHFAAHGIRDTSLRTLASAIGTSQRMLHYHFGSREDLLAAVINAVAEQQARTVRDLIAREPDPYEAGRRNWDSTVSSAEVFGPLYFELASHVMTGQPYAAPLREALVGEQLRAFTAAYETLTTSDRARVLARLTLAVGQGVLFNLLIDGDRAAADAAVAEFTDMMRARLSERYET